MVLSMCICAGVYSLISINIIIEIYEKNDLVDLLINSYSSVLRSPFLDIGCLDFLHEYLTHMLKEIILLLLDVNTGR
jgi:hypothetical protein